MGSRKSTYEDSNLVRKYGDKIVVNRQYVWLGTNLSRKMNQIPHEHPRLDTGINPNRCRFRNRYWIDTPYHHYVFSGGRGERSECRIKALCWAAIMYKIGLEGMDVDSDTVPIEIADLGKPYVAAYLYAVHGYEFSRISQKLNLTESTISQYLSDVAGLRR